MPYQPVTSPYYSRYYELYDPVEKKWCKHMDKDTVVINIVNWVLTEMKNAQPDKEFHEQERETVEKVFGEIEGSKQILCNKDGSKT
jgi:hypothetical protein